MSLILSGSDGLSDIDGSAATPAIRGTDANTGIFFPAADTIAFAEGGVEAARFDSAGNLGVGTTSPAYKLDALSTGDTQVARFRTGGSGTANIASFERNDSAVRAVINYNGADGSMAFGTTTNHATAFLTNNTERARIDSSGNLLVGTTSTIAGVTGGSIQVQNNGSSSFLAKQLNATADTLSVWSSATAGNNVFATFYTETAVTSRGSISYNRAGGLTAYNTTSDYRAKIVNGAVQNALSKVALLKPSTGRMNGATEDIDFFVAHELQEVVPSAVTGEKDAVNEDNTPKYQMVDKSALIPLLTAAIQEQQALITQLQADVAALKAI